LSYPGRIFHGSGTAKKRKDILSLRPAIPVTEKRFRLLLVGIVLTLALGTGAVSSFGQEPDKSQSMGGSQEFNFPKVPPAHNHMRLLL